MELEEPAWDEISYGFVVHMYLCHPAALAFSPSGIRESGTPEKMEIQRGIKAHSALPDACPVLWERLSGAVNNRKRLKFIRWVCFFLMKNFSMQIPDEPMRCVWYKKVQCKKPGGNFFCWRTLCLRNLFGAVPFCAFFVALPVWSEIPFEPWHPARSLAHAHFPSVNSQNYGIPGFLWRISLLCRKDKWTVRFLLVLRGNRTGIILWEELLSPH